MPIQIYNTLTRSKEAFVTREPQKVGMYVCGVTPYAAAHVGHGRSAVAMDVVRRWLVYRGYEVTYVVNVTDVEDKIIAASQQEGRGWREVADEHAASYWGELEELAVLPPTVTPVASEHIDEIVALVTCRAFPNMAGCRAGTWTRRSRERGWRRIRESAIRGISFCGKRPSRASRVGRARGARVARDGTSSAPP